MLILQTISILTTNSNTKANNLDIFYVLICLCVILSKCNNMVIQEFDVYPYGTTILSLTVIIDLVGLLSRLTWTSYINAIIHDNNQHIDCNMDMNYTFNIDLDLIYNTNYIAYCYLQTLKFGLYPSIICFSGMIIIILLKHMYNILTQPRIWYWYQDKLICSQTLDNIRCLLSCLGLYLLILLFAHASLIPVLLIVFPGMSYNSYKKSYIERNNTMYYKLLLEFYIKQSNNLNELNRKICLMHWRSANIINSNCKIMDVLRLDMNRSYEKIQSISQMNENDLNVVNIYQCLYNNDHYVVRVHRKFEQFTKLVNTKCTKRNICVILEKFYHVIINVTQNTCHQIGSTQIKLKIKVVIQFAYRKWHLHRHLRLYLQWKYLQPKLMSFGFDIGLICCMVNLICCLSCALCLSIMCFIEYYNYQYYDSFNEHDILLLLSLMLSIIFFVCICWLLSYAYRIFLIIYVNYHWYCFYVCILGHFGLVKNIIPQILITNVINMYENTSKRNKMIQDSVLGPDVGSIVIKYLPKHCILTTDDKQIHDELPKVFYSLI